MELKWELLQLLDTDPYLSAPHPLESDLALQLIEIYKKSDKNEFIKSIYEVILENLDKKWGGVFIALDVLDYFNMIDNINLFIKFLTDIILGRDSLKMSNDYRASVHLRRHVDLEYMCNLCNKLSPGPIQNNISYQYIMCEEVKSYGDLNNTNNYQYIVYSALCGSRPESITLIKEDIREAIDITGIDKINEFVNTLYLSDRVLPNIKKHIEYVAKNIDEIILKTKDDAS